MSILLEDAATFDTGFKRNQFAKKEMSLNANCVQTQSGGRGWIRTTEVTDNRFTVCPLWPLGNSPIFNFYQVQWSWWTDSNPRPADYKSAALPTELHQHVVETACSLQQTSNPMSIVRTKLFMVEATGLEPAASWSQTKHSTKLSYASSSTFVIISHPFHFVNTFFHLFLSFFNFFAQRPKQATFSA